MMTDLQLLEQIFSDAHVVDIDLSSWDKGIVLYVLADHLEHSEQKGRLPLLRVEFLRVRDWRMMFNHYASDTSHPLSPLAGHHQWWIYKLHVQTNEAGIQIVLRGFDSSPVITTTCDEVSIHPVSLDIPDEFFPNWSKPGSGFIRPSLEQMSQLQQEKNS